MSCSEDSLFSFLLWWELMPGKEKSDFLRSLLRDFSGERSPGDRARRFILHSTGALRRSSLSSAQEERLLALLKSLIRAAPGYPWPSRDAEPYPGSLASPRAEGPRSLYGWQEEAFNAWRQNGCRGIIKAVTGSGKTMVALMAIRQHLAEGGRAVILVPTCTLLGQWKRELKKHLHLADEQVGCAGGGSRCSPRRQTVTIWVLNSARDTLGEALAPIGAHVPILLVVDECHRAGSRVNARVFSVRYEKALGLSATPERAGDPGYEEVLIPHLGSQVYSYDFPRALQDRLIPPFDLVNIGIDFTPWERREYEERCQEIQRRLSRLMNRYRGLRWPICRHYSRTTCGMRFSELARICTACPRYERRDDLEESPLLFKFLYYIAEYLEDPLAQQITTLIIQRKHFVNDAAGRADAVLALLEHTPWHVKTLAFSERIALADEVARRLTAARRDIRCGIYHSAIHQEERSKMLHEFRTGTIDLLLCCRALDEGLDVPSASMGIIMSGANSIRQRIQRLGRILRAHPGKERSVIFHFYVTGTVERQLIFTELLQEGMEGPGFYDILLAGMPSFVQEYFNLQ